jgi:hypothetical protein
MFSHDANRTSLVNGKYYSALLDPVRVSLEQRGFTVTTISHFGSSNVLWRAHGAPLPMNRGYLLAWLLDRLWTRLQPDGEQDPILFFRARLFSKIVARVNPRLVIVQAFPPELAESLKGMLVTTVEILHGFGYGHLPWGYSSRPKALLPDIFLAGDCQSGNTFSQLGVIGVQTKIIKPLQLQDPSKFITPVTQKKKKRLQIPSVDSTSRIISSGTVVMVAMSRRGHFEGEKDQDPTDWSMLMASIKILGPGVRWLFRMHPVQFSSGQEIGPNDSFREFINKSSNCEWERPTTSALFDLLPEVTCILTYGSGIVFDASYSGIRTALLMPPRDGNTNEKPLVKKVWQKFEKSGHLEVVRATSSEVVQWINRASRIEPFLDNSCVALTMEETIDFLENLVARKNPEENCRQ